MIQRISHDLPGAAQRMSQLRDHLLSQADELQATWRDEKSRQFAQQHLAAIRPTIGQLVSSLSEAIELFENLARTVQDPDPSNT